MKFWSIKFQGNPSNGSRADTSEQTDGRECCKYLAFTRQCESVYQIFRSVGHCILSTTLEIVPEVLNIIITAFV
jgi:hypothetical protein